MSYSTLRTHPVQFELSLSNAALIIAFVSFAALAGAWGLELIGGYQPCPLCLEQRIPYYAAIPVGLLAAYLSRMAPIWAALLLAAICVALIYNAGLGIYHAGAEWHFWPGPDTCASGGTLQVGKLSQTLRNAPVVRCDEAALRIFGLSLAGYSVLISAALALIGGLAIWRARPWMS
jgi:disulfide bond formation protein DsbB